MATVKKLVKNGLNSGVNHKKIKGVSKASFLDKYYQKCNNLPDAKETIGTILVLKGMINMVEKKVQFENTEEVEEFVKSAGQCDFDIDILYQHIHIDAKSFLGVLSLGLSKELTVKYFGENAKFEKVIKNYAVA